MVTSTYETLMKNKNRQSIASQLGIPCASSNSLTTRVCSCCQIARPNSEFRRRFRSASTRVNQCRLCHNQAERLRRQRKRGQLNKRQFLKLLTNLKSQQTAKGVERVYLCLRQRLGGTEGLLRLWTAAMERDMAEGGFRAYRHIASILRLMMYCESNQSNHPDYSQLSYEELLDALSQSVLD